MDLWKNKNKDTLIHTVFVVSLNLTENNSTHRYTLFMVSWELPHKQVQDNIRCVYHWFEPLRQQVHTYTHCVCGQLEPTWQTGTHWHTLCLWSTWTYLTDGYTLTHIVFVVSLNVPDRWLYFDTYCVCGQLEPTWQTGTCWHTLCLWSTWTYLTDRYTLTHIAFVVNLNLPGRQVHTNTHCVCGQLEPTWQTGTHWHTLCLWSAWTYVIDRYTLTHIALVVNLNLLDRQVYINMHYVYGQLFQVTVCFALSYYEMPMLKGGPMQRC